MDDKNKDIRKEMKDAGLEFIMYTRRKDHLASLDDLDDDAIKIADRNIRTNFNRKYRDVTIKPFYRSDGSEDTYTVAVFGARRRTNFVTLEEGYRL